MSLGIGGMKRIIVSPADAAAAVLGYDSKAARVTVTYEYDTDVELSGSGRFVRGIRTPMPLDRGYGGFFAAWVLPVDHPDIVSGAEFAITFRFEATPHQGHAGGARGSIVTTKTVQVHVADPDFLDLSDLPDVSGRRRVVLAEERTGLWSPLGLTEIAPGIWG